MTFVLVRLAPHFGAIIGVRSGEDIAPAFSITTLDGAIVSSSDLRGKVVLVNCWATWCPSRLKDQAPATVTV